MTSTTLQYSFAGLLTLVEGAIILTGHGGDPGSPAIISILGVVIGGLFGKGIAENSATRAANGTVNKILGDSEPHTYRRREGDR